MDYGAKTHLLDLITNLVAQNEYRRGNAGCGDRKPSDRTVEDDARRLYQTDSIFKAQVDMLTYNLTSILETFNVFDDRHASTTQSDATTITNLRDTQTLLHNKLAELQTENEKLSFRVIRMRGDIRRSNAHQDELRRRLNNTRDRLHDTRARVEKLQEENCDYYARNVDLTLVVSNIRNNLETQTTRASVLTEKLQREKDRSDVITGNYNRLKRESHRVQKKNPPLDVFTTAAIRLQGDLNAVKEKLEQSTGTLADYVKANDTLASELADLKATIKAVIEA